MSLYLEYNQIIEDHGMKEENDKVTLESMKKLLEKIVKSPDNAVHPKSLDGLKHNVEKAIINLTQRVGGF